MFSKQSAGVSSSKRAQQLELPGKGFVQGCCAFPDGRVFVARWSTVIEIDQSCGTSIYAGKPAVYDSIMGHRLNLARFHNIHTLASVHDRLLVYDYGASILTQIEGDEVRHLAGSGARGHEDGPQEKASFDYVWGITATASGYVILADRDSHRIRVISPSGMVSTIGNGAQLDVDSNFPSEASFCSPFGLATAPSGYIYVGCNGSNKLRAISPDLQKVTTIPIQQLSKPEGITCDANGKLYICEYGASVITEYDPATETSLTIPANVQSPRGVCIPKKGHIMVSQNVDQFGAALIRLEDASVQPFHPFVYNMGLFKGSNMDFNGFEAVSLYRCSSPFSMPEFRLNWHSKPSTYSDKIPELLSPTDCQFLLGRSEPLLFHQDIINLIPTKITLQQALKDLTWQANAFDFPKILMRFLYQCGHSIDLSDIEPVYHVDVYALLSLAIMRMGFCSFQLTHQISKKLNDFSKNLHNLQTPSLTRLLVFLATIPDSELDVIVIEAICGHLSDPKHEFLKFAGGPDEPLKPLHSFNSALGELIVDRINLKIPSLIPVLTQKGEIQKSDQLPVMANDSDIYDAMSKSLALLADNLVWMPRKGEETKKSDVSLEEPHLWSIGIQGYSKVLRMHDWALYSRWKYFRRMIDSGMAETETRTLELPSDFPPDALLSLMQYVYSLSPSLTFSNLASANYIKQVAEEYELVDSDGLPSHGFCPFISALDDAIASSKGERPTKVINKPSALP